MEREDGGIIAYQEDASLEEAISQNIKVHRVRAARWWEINMLLYVTGILPATLLIGLGAFGAEGTIFLTKRV